jgi:membrane peptidoglycan carboxypeptidase
MKSGRISRARLHSFGGPSSRTRSRKGLVRIVAVALAGVLVLGIAGYAYATSWLDGLPQVTSLDATNHDTLIYDRNGVLLADIGNGGDHRVSVGYNQISQNMVNATVATEDRTFWTNSGFDPQGIARSVLGNFQHKAIVGGGSTITQQLAKELFLGSEVSYSRKIKEVLLAYQLTQKYSKKEILTAYLNENNYGEHLYGVQAASRSYFQKDAKDLDLAQASLLAGLPQAPYDYDPITHLDSAKARQRDVLDSMVTAGYVKPAEADAAYAEQLQISAPVNNFLAPHFVDYVRTQLEGLGFKVGQQQLVVKTTLDYGKQQLAEQVVRDNLAKNKSRDPNGLLDSAMVSMDPNTGQIVTYVGSPDFNNGAQRGQVDYAGVNPINAGSSVKPYTYALALSDGIATMDTPIYDGPSPFVVHRAGAPDWQVYNYVHRAYGMQPLRVAFANSLNISAVKTELADGVANLVDFQRSLGLKPRIPMPDGSLKADAPNTDYQPSLTLGTYPITLVEHAAAVSVFANLGTYHQPESVLAVTDPTGRAIYQADPNRGMRTVFPDHGVPFLVNSILSDDNNRSLVFGRGTPLHLNDRHAAAKTGTTDDYKDALTVGWTPDLVSVFWVGDILGIQHTMASGSDGVYVAAPAWHQFMEQALKGVPDRWYQLPSSVVRGQGNSYDLKTATKVDGLAGETGPTPSPSPGNYGVPPDPGTGPVLIGPSPRPTH